MKIFMQQEWKSEAYFRKAKNRPHQYNLLLPSDERQDKSSSVQ